MSTGINNKNWLNIKAITSENWKGQVGVDSRGHAIFRSPAYSIRAGLKTLRTYHDRRGLVTFEQVFERWAPSSDTIGSIPGNAPNDPNAYAKFVARYVNSVPMGKLGIFREDWSIGNEDRAYGILRAMCRYELGPGFYALPASDLVIKIGLYLYQADYHKATGDIVREVMANG